MMLTRTLAGGFVVLGPCPGCETWSVCYDHEVPETYSTIYLDTDGTRVDATAWYEGVESILREHYDECEPLQELAGPL